MSEQRYLHFTLGPVQGFVSQARRTRDFWAGSFILSWLSAVAMKAVQAQGGEIRFPRPDQAFMAALEVGGRGPRQGNVPNRFKAAVGAGFMPGRVVESVHAAWRGLAEAVWRNDLEGVADDAVRAVWERQIEGFWEMQWALVDDPADATPIDRLKSWRTHLPVPEPGPKCTMMGGWQEISGAERPGAEGDAFWKRLRGQGATGIRTDLREAEALCAVAYVKRRFSRVFGRLRLPMPGDWTLHGWQLPSGVPSVQYMAVAPWLASLIGKAVDDDELGSRMWKFHEVARQLTGEYGEWETNVRCVRDAVRNGGCHEWAALDGSVFFGSLLENEALWEDPGLAKAVERQLGELRKRAALGPVSPFYAILMMDGDELGKQMSDPRRQDAITEGLAYFTDGMDRIVRDHNGFLIYAGGDDVLALCTLEDVLPCAAAVRQHYLACFEGREVRTSISAAIEYVHIKTPLGTVLADAHRLLDEIAKDATGRDAVACRVWKPGGLASEWAMPWEKALDLDGDVEVQRLAQDFRRHEDGAEGMSSKFFYAIRERFDVLNPVVGAAPILGPDEQLDLLAMQFLNSGINRKEWSRERARNQIEPLYRQCQSIRRRQTEAEPAFNVTPHLRVDGALLVRFLAHKGIER